MPTGIISISWKIRTPFQTLYYHYSGKAFWKVYNFSRFGDGDRCIFVARELAGLQYQARRIWFWRFLYEPDQEKKFKWIKKLRGIPHFKSEDSIFKATYVNCELTISSYLYPLTESKNLSYRIFAIYKDILLRKEKTEVRMFKNRNSSITFSIEYRFSRVLNRI